MEVVIVAGAEAVADAGASIVATQVAAVPDSTLGLATGSSPLGVYRSLIERHRNGDLSFLLCEAVMLDEYVGLPPDHAQAYRTVIRRDLIDSIDLPLDRLHSPDVAAADVAASCTRYDALVRSLGVDIQLLGIGSDGHLAFNEPGSSLASSTRIKTLTDRTRADNARFFDDLDEVPRHVITQGLGTIMEAAHLVLLATGSAKAAPIAAAVEGPVSAMCPASVLQFHPHVTVIVDEAAASQLQLTDYYCETLAHKPSWQRH
ncbi:MAG: glucosamine-6-phosphate deaminase [Ilumatobacteraceae bacterium]|nr:glucosamine-6-phosphate deaminase [Ilumatobacteraceae bacterium]